MSEINVLPHWGSLFSKTNADTRRWRTAVLRTTQTGLGLIVLQTVCGHADAGLQPTVNITVGREDARPPTFLPNLKKKIPPGSSRDIPARHPCAISGNGSLRQLHETFMELSESVLPAAV